VEFSGDAWLGYKPVLYPEAYAGGDGGGAKIVLRKLEVALRGLDVLFLSQVDGKRAIRDIVADPRLASNGEAFNQARDFFSRMWRLGLMLFPR
jgi:hypothetical protein